MALLGGSDYANNAFGLTIFINEQRGGPALSEILNSSGQFPKTFPAVTWANPVFQLQERGVLTGSGYLPLPAGLEDTILETWSLDSPGETLELYGNHLAEGVIDNRNGDIITLIGGLAPIWGTTLSQLRGDANGKIVLEMVEQIYDIRVAIDFKNPDTLLAQIRIHAAKDVGTQLEFFVPFAMPMLTPQLETQYGLSLKSENVWNPAEETYTLDLTISGVEKKLRNYFRSAIPVTAGA